MSAPASRSSSSASIQRSSPLRSSILRGLRRCLAEPLVHFAVLGGLLFSLYHELEGEEDGDDRVIVLRASTSESLRRELERKYGRAPTPEELKRATEDWLTAEALYRHGLRLGLDKGDPTIRQQVINNLRELQLLSVDVKDPSPEELTHYIQEHHERYAGVPPLYSFEQYYFSAAQERQAREWLAELEKTPPPVSAKAGAPREPERPSMQSPIEQRLHMSRSEDYIAQIFGQQFLETLRTTEKQKWRLITSLKGAHVVRLKRISGGPPDPEQLRRRALRDLQDARRQEALAKEDQRIRNHYQVRAP